MNIDERKRLIFEFLFSETGLLRRYAAPEMLSADRQRDEINDMVTDLNSEIPGHFTQTDLEHLFETLRVQVRRRHGTRSWPTIKVLLAALADALGKMNTCKETDDVEAFMVSRLAIWFQKFGDEMPGCGSDARTEELVRRGVMTAVEARKAGFSMSATMREAATEE